jgi:diguanylate cyclase (GGDEF)-like protein
VLDHTKNRRGFYQRVQPLFEQCAKTNTPFVLVSADLNGLKTINDTYGHADGDIAISTVGQALAQESSANATCARFGGDEFVAAWACNSSSSEEEAAFRKRIQNYLDEFNASSGKPYTISSSLGIVVAVPSEDITLDEFIKVTDEKMYEEKAKYHQTHKR